MSRMRRGLHAPHILITAGPTREPLDPVRFLSNHSSGDMGLSLASAFVRSGARVTVVLGPVTIPVPHGIDVVRVITARDMSDEVRRRLPRCDAFVATAAVCDWRPAAARPVKMKKGAANRQTLRLIANPDILLDAGRWKRSRARPLLVGFALETHDLEREARRKLIAKNLDLIIGNSPDTFSSPSIKPLWIERDGLPRALSRQSKKALSSLIARWTFRRLCADKEPAR